MAKYTDIRAGLHDFFSARPGDMYGNSTPGPSPASEMAGRIKSGVSSAISPERLEDMKAIGEAGKQISETMETIESVASSATQSLQEYRGGVKDVGESLKDFAEKIPVIGQSLKAGEAVGGLIGYALFGTESPEMIEAHIKAIESGVERIGNAKLDENRLDEERNQRLEDAKEQKIRQSLSGNELKRHNIEYERDLKIREEDTIYDSDMKQRNANLGKEIGENKQRGGAKSEIHNREIGINARYQADAEESDRMHKETIGIYQESARIQLNKLDSPSANHGNSSSNSDSGLITELKTVNQVLLQIKESLGFQ